jgi:hypothetical protein
MYASFITQLRLIHLSSHAERVFTESDAHFRLKQAKSLLPADRTVVYVVGRDVVGAEYKTTDDGSDTASPLVVRNFAPHLRICVSIHASSTHILNLVCFKTIFQVLVDGGTASAAEVFAAALQVTCGPYSHAIFTCLVKDKS